MLAARHIDRSSLLVAFVAAPAKVVVVAVVTLWMAVLVLAWASTAITNAVVICWR